MKAIQSQQNKTFFLIMLAGVLIVSFFVLKPYLALTALAFFVAAIFRPVYNKLLKISKSESIASLTTILVIFLCILVPIAFITLLTYNQVLEFNRDIQKFLATSNLNSFADIDVHQLLDNVNSRIREVPGLEDNQITVKQVTNFVGDTLGEALNFLADRALTLGSSTISIITNTIVFVFLLGVFLTSQEKIGHFIQKISPLDNELDQMYLRKVTDMGVAMIKGTFIIAIFQGIASGLVLYLMGVDYAIFWTLVCIFVGIVPLGSGVVTVPIGLILVLTGNYFKGLIIILNYVLIVSNIDNFLRPRLVPKDSGLHPALTLLGVLGGISLFGPLGFIFGPIVMIFLTTTLDVYVRYYKQ